MEESLITKPIPIVAKRQSLRQRLTSALGLLLVTAVLLGILVVLRFVYLTEQRTWQERQHEAAQNAATTVTSFMSRVKEYIGFVALLDPEYLEAHPDLTSDLLNRNVALLEIIRVDREGIVIANDYREEVPLLGNLFTIPQSSWFLRAREGRYYISDVEISAQNDPYLILATPTTDGGVVAARLRMNVLWNVIAGIRFGESGRAYIVNERGRIIAHPEHEIVLKNTTIADHPEMLAVQQALGRQWIGTYRNFEGKEVIGATMPISDSNWIIFTEIPREEASTITRSALFQLGGGALLFGILIHLVTRSMLNQIVLKPIERLRNGAKRIGQGNLNYRLEIESTDELGQVAAEFNEMAALLREREGALAEARDEALAASQFKSRLLANVSHDLRTPLNGILGYTDMLKEGVYGSLTDQQNAANERILANAQRLLDLVNQLLGQAQIESGRVELHYQPFDPARLLDETDVTTRYQAEKKGLTLITEIAPELPNPLTGDPQYIQQILSNLVSNAIKFTDEGTVGVRLYPDGENWIIEVADTGPGIPPEAQSHIFEPFWQVDSTTTRTKGGIGLGLSIVRQLTALMGGTVRLVSEIGQGSTFTISLPLTPQGENKA